MSKMLWCHSSYFGSQICIWLKTIGNGLLASTQDHFYRYVFYDCTETFLVYKTENVHDRSALNHVCTSEKVNLFKWSRLFSSQTKKQQNTLKQSELEQMWKSRYWFGQPKSEVREQITKRAMPEVFCTLALLLGCPNQHLDFHICSLNLQMYAVFFVGGPCTVFTANKDLM